MRISDWSSDVCSSDLFSQELQVNGSLGPLSLTAGTYYYDEDIDYTLTADILPGMYGFLVNAGICPSAAAPCFAATRGFRQPSTLSIKAYAGFGQRSEEHTSELQSLMRISYAVFCLKKKKKTI